MYETRTHGGVRGASVSLAHRPSTRLAEVILFLFRVFQLHIQLSVKGVQVILVLIH